MLIVSHPLRRFLGTRVEEFRFLRASAVKLALVLLHVPRGL
jgi:hypothetical protein